MTSRRGQGTASTWTDVCRNTRSVHRSEEHLAVASEPVCAHDDEVGTLVCGTSHNHEVRHGRPTNATRNDAQQDSAKFFLSLALDVMGAVARRRGRFDEQRLVHRENRELGAISAGQPHRVSEGLDRMIREVDRAKNRTESHAAAAVSAGLGP